jgi:hypothetical protein
MTLPDHAELIERLLGPHEWGYRCLAEGGFISDEAPVLAAVALQQMAERVREMEGAWTPGRHLLAIRMAFFNGGGWADPLGWSDFDANGQAQYEALAEQVAKAPFLDAPAEVSRMRKLADEWRRPGFEQIQGPGDFVIHGLAIADDIDRWADMLEARQARKDHPDE